MFNQIMLQNIKKKMVKITESDSDSESSHSQEEKDHS